MIAVSDVDNGVQFFSIEFSLLYIKQLLCFYIMKSEQMGYFNQVKLNDFNHIFCEEKKINRE